jgi:hypothetical protein
MSIAKRGQASPQAKEKGYESGLDTLFTEDYNCIYK